MTRWKESAISIQVFIDVLWYTDHWTCWWYLIKVISLLLVVVFDKAIDHFDGLVQERRNSSALAMKLHFVARSHRFYFMPVVQTDD